MHQLLLPPLLVELIGTGRWRQPSDQVIQQAIPFLKEPIDFLLDRDSMQRESMGFLADDHTTSELFHVYRGSELPERELPWLDIEKTLIIAVNRIAGADIGIALDYRTNLDDPRVVASDWWSGDQKHYWRKVENRFSEFAKKLGI